MIWVQTLHEIIQAAQHVAHSAHYQLRGCHLVFYKHPIPRRPKQGQWQTFAMLRCSRLRWQAGFVYPLATLQHAAHTIAGAR